LSAIENYRQAVAHWTAIVQKTDGVFYDHMVFNRPPDQIGHWKHELPFLQADLARLEEIDRVFLESSVNPEQVLKWTIESPRGKMAMKWKEERGVLSRSADTSLTPEDPASETDVYSMQHPRFVVKNLLTAFRYAKILHAPVRNAVAGSPAQVHASYLGGREKARLTLFYRLAGSGFRFTPVEMAEDEKNVYAGQIPAAKAGDTVYYFIRATDETGYFHGSEKEPYAIAVSASPAVKPVIRHTDIAQARVGAPVAIQARIDTAAKPAAVRLYYRHLDQSEDWTATDMKERATGEYHAVIPAEFMVPGWDIMYAIEAVDVAGSGAFYPDLDIRQPFVVTRVTQLNAKPGQ
ncbi:MAG: hypothetical protein ABIZ80_17840, partial [Bryobacteraceae bacterium]